VFSSLENSITKQTAYYQHQGENIVDVLLDSGREAWRLIEDLQAQLKTAQERIKDLEQTLQVKLSLISTIIINIGKFNVGTHWIYPLSDMLRAAAFYCLLALQTLCMLHELYAETL
jgi:hypothetical protein